MESSLIMTNARLAHFSDGDVRGTSDDKGNITVYDIPAGTAIPVSQFQMQAPDGNRASCGTFEFTINKRMSRRFLMLASYNWTGEHYLIDGVPNNPNQAYNNYVKDDYWIAHASGTYLASWGLVISPVLRMQQGQNQNRILNATGLRVGTADIPERGEVLVLGSDANRRRQGRTRSVRKPVKSGPPVFPGASPTNPPTSLRSSRGGGDFELSKYYLHLFLIHPDNLDKLTQEHLRHPTIVSAERRWFGETKE